MGAVRDTTPGAFLEALVASGLLAPEEASAILLDAARVDPARAVVRAGFASPDQIRTALDLARTLIGTGVSPESAEVLERRRMELDHWIEGARTVVVPPAPAPAPARPSELDQGDPARSVLFGRSPLGPALPDRYECGALVRREAGRDVHAGRDLDLARDVEIHAASHGTRPEALPEAGNLLAKIAGPAVPILFGSGQDAAGEPFLVLSPPSGDSLAKRLAEIPAGISGATVRLELARAVLVAARAVERAHERGALHLGISPATIHAGIHGAVSIAGWGAPEVPSPGAGRTERSPTASSGSWSPRDPGPVSERDPYRAPEILHGRAPGPAADVYSLGMVLAEIVLGAPVHPARRSRARPIPGLFPELAAVAWGATLRRPRDRYSSAGDFARDLERALSGEAVVAGRSPLFRRVTRLARRHPMGVLVASTIAVVLVIAVPILVLARHAAERDRVLALEAEAEPVLDDVEREIDEAEASPARRVTELSARAGQDETAEALLDAKAQLQLVFQTTALARARLASLPEPLPPELEERRDEIAERATTMALEAAAKRLGRLVERARSDEERTWCTATVGRVRSTRALARLLVDGAVKGPEFKSALGAAPEPWREVALLLAGLASATLPERSGAHPFDEAPAVAAALELLECRAELVIADFPDDIEARLLEVDTSGSPFELLPRCDLAPGDRSLLDPGEYVVEFAGPTESGRVEVRHIVFLARGESLLLRPDFPREAPPAGNYVYCPRGRFRAGGDAPNAKPLRTVQLERAFWISRTELTLGEWLRYLTEAARGGALLDIPTQQTAAGLSPMVDASTLRVLVPGYTEDMPVAGVSQEAALRYAAWLMARDQEGWRYELPSEEEWEYAASGAGARRYPWGDRWLPARAMVASLSSPFGLLAAESLPERASPFGLLHVAGNVTEWTASHYGLAGFVTQKGGWSGSAEDEWARGAARHGAHPRSVDAHYGFRLVALAR